MHAGSRMLIFGGGALGEWAIPHIGEGDVLVGADQGAWFLVSHGYRPHLAMGDFDSVTAEQKKHIQQMAGEFRDCDPIMKDYTDSELAYMWALQQRPAEIVLLGMTGTRLDHTLANVQLLRQGLAAGVRTVLRNEHNRIELTNGRLELTDEGFSYISLLPLTIEVQGITLEGFQYPLRDAVLTMGQSLAVSNKLVAPAAAVTVRSGELLVIQSRD
ncbi:thiamine diphosphokinase [Xylanibacillus composti]|nr:thiamine diphosphokinase [Xylanibacillus composti]